MRHPLLRTSRHLSSVIALLAALTAPMAASTCTWTAAGATSNFSDAGNWDAVPTPDCIMVFPSGAPFASKGAPVNDLIGLTINQLNISEAYNISGNAVTCKNINDHCAQIVNVSLPMSTSGSAVLTITVSVVGGTLNLSGKLSGAGPVTYSGPGNKRLNGSVNNTVSGLSTVAQGHLTLDSAAPESIAGALHIDSGAYVVVTQAPTIKNTIIVSVDGTFDLSATVGNEGTDSEIIGGLSGGDTSAMVLLGAHTLGCTGQTAPTNYLGGFSGTGGFRQSTSGVEVISGTSFPYTGTTTLAGGSIHIWGSLLGSPVLVSSGTLVLANDASVGPVTVSGSASVLSCNETISAMAMHGTTPSLTLTGGSTLSVVSKSPTDYTTISTAAVSLSGAQLVVDTALFTPTPASVMTIITNTGANPIAGTFTGLAQGATVVSASNSGTTFTISYTGGSGNDVTLTGVTIATDFVAPVISLVATSAITGDSATVSWSTDETSSSQVEYGLTTLYGSQTTLNTALVTSHSQALSSLSGATTYHYRVQSRDGAGNLATSADATFTTAADAVAPLISAVSVGNVNGTSAVITWNTDEASDSQIEYGTTTSYGSQTTLDTSLVTTHHVTVSGLTLSTPYHYRVHSGDATGNQVTTTDATFTTTDGSVVVANDNDDDHHGRCGSGSGIMLLGILLALSLSMRGKARKPRA